MNFPTVNTTLIKQCGPDDAKNQANIEKHYIDFADAVDIFNHPILELLDEREDYGEDRYISVGLIKSLFGVVVYTERHNDMIRIISAEKPQNMRCVTMKKDSKTDWKRLSSMTDEQNNTDDIAGLDDAFFRDAQLKTPPKQPVTLRIDADVLAFFKAGRSGLSNAY